MESVASGTADVSAVRRAVLLDASRKSRAACSSRVSPAAGGGSLLRSSCRFCDAVANGRIAAQLRT